MEWPIIALGSTLATLIVVLTGFRMGVRANDRRYVSARIRTEPLSVYLMAVRREIANALMVRDHNRFVQTTIQALREIERIRGLTESEARKEKADFENKYEHAENFTPFPVLEHVLYSDATGNTSYEDLEERYLDMVGYSAIIKVIYPMFDILCWLPSKDHLDHLIEYAKQIDDTLLRRRIRQAMSEYRKYGQGLSEFVTSQFEIKKIYHPVDVRFGIHFIESNEYTIVSYYLFDDGYISDTYYRSDENFQTEQTLHHCDVTLPFGT